MQVNRFNTSDLRTHYLKALTYLRLRHFSVRRQSIGYKTVAIRSNRLKLGDHNVEAFHDTHTQNQVNL